MNASSPPLEVKRDGHRPGIDRMSPAGVKTWFRCKAKPLLPKKMPMAGHQTRVSMVESSGESSCSRAGHQAWGVPAVSESNYSRAVNPEPSARRLMASNWLSCELEALAGCFRPISYPDAWVGWGLSPARFQKLSGLRWNDSIPAACESMLEQMPERSTASLNSDHSRPGLTSWHPAVMEGYLLTGYGMPGDWYLAMYALLGQGDAPEVSGNWCGHRQAGQPLTQQSPA